MELNYITNSTHSIQFSNRNSVPTHFTPVETNYKPIHVIQINSIFIIE